MVEGNVLQQSNSTHFRNKLTEEQFSHIVISTDGKFIAAHCNFKEFLILKQNVLGSFSIKYFFPHKKVTNISHRSFVVFSQCLLTRSVVRFIHDLTVLYNIVHISHQFCFNLLISSLPFIIPKKISYPSALPTYL